VGHLSLGFLLIDATRYNLGRPGEPARQFCFALAKTLPQIMPHVRQQLVQDVAAALNKDAVSQAVRAGQQLRGTGPPTYEPADRQAWQGLLLVAAALGTTPNEFRAAAGS
jgi:hypothetical protein